MQFWKDIVLCYNNDIIMKMTPKVPPLLTWHISQIIVSFILPIITCVLNQPHGHWLFNDVLQYAIVMNLKLKKTWNSTSLRQYDEWWCWNCFWIDLTYFKHKMGSL